MPLSDNQLIERFLDDQDEDAFEQLVRRHSNMVWEVCRRLLWQTQDAEDAYQVAFILLSTHAKKLLEYRSIGGWLHGTTVRTCLNIRRQACRSREMQIEHTAFDHEAEPWRKIALARDQELLHQAIVDLPKRYREAVVLCLLEGKSRAEAASILQCTKNAVKAALARGRRLLRIKLLKQGLGASVVWTVLATSSVANAAGGVASTAQSLSPAEPLIRTTVELCTSPNLQLPQTLSSLVQSLTHKKLVSANWITSPNVILASAAVVLGTLMASTGFVHLDFPSKPELQIVSSGTSELMMPVHLEAVLSAEPPQEDAEAPENPLVDDYRSRQENALKNELTLIQDQLGLDAEVIEDIRAFLQAELDDTVKRFAASWSTKRRSVFIFSDRLDENLRKAVWKKAATYLSPEKVSKHAKLAADASELYHMYHASSQQEVVWFLDQLLSLSEKQQSLVEKKLAESWDLEWTELFQYQTGFADENVCMLIGSSVDLRDVLNPTQQTVFNHLPLYSAANHSDWPDPNAAIWNFSELKRQYLAMMELKTDRMEKRYQLSANQKAQLDIAGKGAVSKTISVLEDAYEKLHGSEEQSQDQLDSYLKDHPLTNRCITEQCTSSEIWSKAIKNVFDDQQFEKWNADQELARQVYRQWNINRAVFVISSNTSLSLEQHQKLVKLLQAVDMDRTTKSNLTFIDEITKRFPEEELAEIRRLLSDSQATQVLSWFQQ